LDSDVEQKLHWLRSDYEAVVGHSFSHFYCPILYRDEDVELCKAHIINRSFEASSRKWTTQRKDVDNFFGSVFEGDFGAMKHHGGELSEKVLLDPDLSKQLRPKILLGGEEIQHFLAQGPVPRDFTEVVVAHSDGPVRLGLKIHPDDALAATGKGWEIAVEKDVRLPALASLLKAAHLTLFELLGYRYALSAGGHFLGRTVLGDFFLQHRGFSKAEVLLAAASHFGRFANMMRPVLDPPAENEGTITDHDVFLCRCTDETPWAFIVFVRTSDLLHAVVVPVLESASASERFVTFLRGDGCALRGNRCRFEGDKWLGARQSEVLTWPKADFL
jgi:hypothetical protein